MANWHCPHESTACRPKCSPVLGTTTCITSTVWKPERRFSQGASCMVSSARLLEGETDMTTIEFASETPRITTRPAVATRVLNALANAYVAWKNRRAFYRLGEMSDAELADIGLTRADLHVAVAIPFG